MRPQIEVVSHVVGVLQEFRLSGVTLTPVPFLLQVVIERIGVFHAFNVTSRARVSIPVPGAANIVAGFKYASRKPGAQHLVERVHSCEACPDNDGVDYFVVSHANPAIKAIGLLTMVSHLSVV